MLSHLHVEVHTCNLGPVLLGCVTWSASAQSSSGSKFNVLLFHILNNVRQIDDTLHEAPLLSVLGASELNGRRPFEGTFNLTLRSPAMPLDR